MQGKKISRLLVISLAIPFMVACSANWQLSEEIHGTIVDKNHNHELEMIVIKYEHENGETITDAIPIDRITNQDKELDQYQIGQDVLLKVYKNEEARTRPEDVVDLNNRKFEIIEK